MNARGLIQEICAMGCYLSKPHKAVAKIIRPRGSLEALEYDDLLNALTLIVAERMRDLYVAIANHLPDVLVDIVLRYVDEASSLLVALRMPFSYTHDISRTTNFHRLHVTHAVNNSRPVVYAMYISKLAIGDWPMQRFIHPLDIHKAILTMVLEESDDQIEFDRQSGLLAGLSIAEFIAVLKDELRRELAHSPTWVD